jgi:heat shock protein HtpX
MGLTQSLYGRKFILMTAIDNKVWAEHAWSNRLQSLFLLAVMAGFSFLLGNLLWGTDAVMIIGFMGLLGLLFSQPFAPWVIMRMYRAQRLTPAQAPELFAMLQQLSQRAGLPQTPQLFYIPSDILNAFAVGTQNHSAIGITHGLLQQLNQRELAGVLAHEISHIRSNDLWIMGIADLFARVTSVLSLMGQFLIIVNLPLLLLSTVTINWYALLLMVFAPNLSTLAQLALSRTREFDADLNAARITQDPAGLASALAKIEQRQGHWFERIFLPGRKIPDPSLLRTHPPTEERIKRLMALVTKYSTAHVDTMPEWQNMPLAQHKVIRKPRWHIHGLWY